MFQRLPLKMLRLATCLICAANTSAQASSVTFSGEFNAESDKIFFHGTTTELSPTDLPLNIIYVTSTGAAAGGFATSITYSEPTGGAFGLVGTEYGHPDAQASRTIAGTDYYFVLTMLGNELVGDLTHAFAPGGAGIDTAFAFDGLTGSVYCAPGVGMFCLATDPLSPRTAHWSLTFTNFDSVEQLQPTSPVPLPATLPLFASGLVGLGWLSRRRRKQSNHA